MFDVATLHSAAPLFAERGSAVTDKCRGPSGDRDTRLILGPAVETLTILALAQIKTEHQVDRHGLRHRVSCYSGISRSARLAAPAVDTELRSMRFSRV